MPWPLAALAVSTDFLETPILGNPLWRWAAGVGTLLLTAVVLRIAIGLAARRLGKLRPEVRAGITDLPLEIVASTKRLFYVVLGLWLGSQWLPSRPHEFRTVLGVVVTFVVFLQVGIWAVHVVKDVVIYWLRRRSSGGGFAFEGLVGSMVGFIVWVVVGLVLLENLGVDVAGLIATLGIVGLAVGMAAKDLFSDLFASLAIVIDRPFQTGDFIIVGDLMGTVERIGMKTCRLRSLSGEQLVLSNSDLLGSRIRNYKRMQERRIVFRFGVEYDTPADRLGRIPGWVKEIVGKQGDARFDRAHFLEFGDSALTFEVVYYVTLADYNRYCDIQQRINLDLFEKLTQEGVAFAFPTQTLHVASLPASSTGA